MPCRGVKAGSQLQAGVCKQEAPVHGEGFSLGQNPTSSSRSDINSIEKEDCVTHTPGGRVLMYKGGQVILLPVKTLMTLDFNY